jgi:hypothetical protein
MRRNAKLSWVVAVSVLAACGGKTLGAGPHDGVEAGSAEGFDGGSRPPPMESGADGSAPTPSDDAEAGPGVVVLASNQACPIAIAVDDTSVYWANWAPMAPGSIVKVPLAGGEPTTLAANLDQPLSLAVDAMNVYWTTGNDSAGTVMKVPLAGGSPTTLASIQAGSPSALAVAGSNVYFTTGGGVVMSVPVGGGAPVTLASGQDNPFQVVLEGTGLYWANYDPSGAGAIMTLAIGGSTPVALASGIVPQGLAATSASVYWTSIVGHGSAVTSVPVGGGIPTTLATGASGTAFSAIAVDDASVYWADFFQGRLMKLPLGGSSVTTLADMGPTSGLGFGSGSMALGPTDVYLTACGSENLTNGSVVKVAK